METETLEVVDVYGQQINKGDEVRVPEPSEYGSDGWEHGFVGTVVDIDAPSNIIEVLDPDDKEVWDIDAERVEIV